MRPIAQHSQFGVPLHVCFMTLYFLVTTVVIYDQCISFNPPYCVCGSFCADLLHVGTIASLWILPFAHRLLAALYHELQSSKGGQI